MPKNLRTSISHALALPLCCMCLGAAAQESERSDPLVFYVSDQLTYEDNLFRLPDVASQEVEAPLVEDRDDYVNQVSAGLRTRMHMGRQDLLFTARVDDVQFNNNDQLDYTGGIGNLTYNWELGSRWSGKATADYQRTLASYTNYRFLSRDIVDAAGAEIETRFGLGARFSVIAAVRARQTDHSDVTRQAENFESHSGRLGLEYSPATGDRIALEYRRLEAEFPDRTELERRGVSRRGYDEDLANLRWEYELTAKTRFEGMLGHLEREYPYDPDNEGFSGEVWRGTLTWQPRLKLGFDLSAWHELKAYVDSESDYFVAEGASLGPTWEPLERLSFSLNYVYERQDYIGTPTLSSELDPLQGLPTLVSDPSREDEVQAARFSASYAPREFIELDILWSYRERSSNRVSREHDAQIVSMALRVIF